MTRLQFRSDLAVPVALSLIFMLWVIWELKANPAREAPQARLIADVTDLSDCLPAANNATPGGHKSGTVVRLVYR